MQAEATNSAAIPPQPLLDVPLRELASEEIVVAFLDQLRLGLVAAKLVGVPPDVALGVATVVEVQPLVLIEVVLVECMEDGGRNRAREMRPPGR